MNDPAPAIELRNSAQAQNSSDYEQDFMLWLESQLDLLRARKFEQLDLENIIEELDSMGRNDKRELQSRLEVLIAHLLKCQCQPDKKSGSWIGTLNEQRSQIEGLLDISPSLRRLAEESAVKRYPAAVSRAASETGIDAAVFPSALPFTLEQLLDTGFIP